MRNVLFVLILGVLVFAMPSIAAVPYPYVRADAVFSNAAPGGKTISVQIRLHNSGDLAASCTVNLGGQTKVTGISSAGEAVVNFDGVRNYKGYTVACSVN